MAVSDPIADMLTKLRNASLAKHDYVDISTSKMKLQIIRILKNEGFIKNFKKVVDEEGGVQTNLRVYLKYDEAQAPVLHGIKRISTPGRRVYSGYKDMPRVYNGNGVVVVSSSNGIITGKQAKENRVGGELICTIW